MKRGLALSIIFHAGALLAMLVIAHPFRVTGAPTYPVVYRVNLVHLPAPAVEDATGSVDPPELLPIPQPRTQNQKQPSTKSTMMPKKTNDGKQDGGKGMPQGMKVISSDIDSPTGDYYLGIILAKISQHWQNPYAGDNKVMRTLVYFKITPDGNVPMIETEKSSGDVIFDIAAMRAVHLAKPFPPFPDEIRLPALGVHFEFEFVK